AERSDQFADAQLFGYAIRMYRPGTAEGEQRERARVAAPLDGVDSRRIGHVLIDHLVHGPGGAGDVETQWIRELLLDGALSGCHVERHTPAEEVVRVQVAENEVSIGDGWVSAAAAIADRPRFRTRRIRAHFEQPEAVDACDAA